MFVGSEEENAPFCPCSFGDKAGRWFSKLIVGPDGGETPLSRFFGDKATHKDSITIVIVASEDDHDLPSFLRRQP